MDVYQFLEEAKKINLEWLKSRITEIIIENELIFVDMLRAQWESGVNEAGKAVGRYKAITENFYSLINPPSSGMPKQAGEPYNLIWSGELIRLTSIDLEVKDDELILIIDSSDSSKNSLFSQIRKEGLVSEPDSIFGLQEVNLGKVVDMTEYDLIENFKKTLQIN